MGWAGLGWAGARVLKRFGAATDLATAIFRVSFGGGVDAVDGGPSGARDSRH